MRHELRFLMVGVTLVAIACTPDYQCGPFVYDPGVERCVCPPGTTIADGGASCALPDGGLLVMDGAVLPDAGVPITDAGMLPDARAIDAAPCVPSAESCNALDDDCDSIVDGPAAGVACGTRDHATALGCTAGACVVTMCATGFGDCNGDVEDGCEARLDTLASCGSCGNTCGWDCAESDCDDIVQVVSGHDHRCAVRESGRVMCWGDNAYGQLGTGESGAGTERSVPVYVVGASGTGMLENVVQVAPGLHHSCARTAAGDVWCWGANESRQLGDGTTTPRMAPVRVIGVSGAIDVTAGGQHSCALLESGRVECWGVNDRGQLGVGDLEPRTGPTEVLDVSDARQVRTLGDATYALRSDGTVRAWGNQFGGLGAGFSGSTSRAIIPTGVTGATELAVGRGHVCALVGPERVWCWGSNYQGQLGPTVDYITHEFPLALVPPVPAIHVFAGRSSVCFVSTDGRVGCWGLDGGETGVFVSAADALEVAPSSGTSTSSREACVRTTTGALRCRTLPALEFIDVPPP